jgi:hypothetical protein
MAAILILLMAENEKYEGEVACSDVVFMPSLMKFIT